MEELWGLIPAAGRGIRAYPYTEALPKCLLEVDGVPLLRRNIELMRDALGIEDVVVVIGHHGERIREYLGESEWLGVRVHIVENRHLDRELAWSIHLGAKRVRGHCCVILSDELYLESNHADLLRPPYRSALVTCGLIVSESSRQVRKNYSARLQGDAIVGLVEKPKIVTDPWMGVGTYLLHPDALERLANDFEREDREAPSDWTTWIGGLASGGERVLPFFLEGAYVNVNNREDLNQANLLARNQTFESRTTSLVYLVDEVEDEIEESVRRFSEAEELDEIVVTARRNAPALESLAQNRKVRVLIREDPEVPLGILLRAGLDAATGDILIIAYSYDNFSPRDLGKLLVYLRDADLVVGTRTTRQMIEQGSNMRGVVRASNVALAKLMEMLWWRFDSRFTDVCCVYRALWKSTYRTIRSELVSPGIEIFPEMVIEVLRARRRIIEVPVNFYNRDLREEFVRTRYQTVGTFVRMLWLILRKRFFSRPKSPLRLGSPSEAPFDV